MTVGIGSLVGGRYRLDELLGRGGMADVYRATDERLGRSVAVKVLRLQADPGTERERFAAEAMTLARLDHPSIVTLLDAGLEDAQPWLAMQLVEGTNLGDWFGNGPLPAAEIAIVGGQLADALAYAHAAGVVHRDVKPGNILLTADRRALLADFGIAHVLDSATRHTAVGQAVGSPAWLAPEQAAGEAVSAATDVYSLGLVLLEALTGERPFRGTTTELVHARLAAPPAVPASLPPGWAALLGSMTALSPADRPSAAEVGRRLAAYDGADVLLDPEETAPFAVAGGVGAAADGATADGAAEATRVLPTPVPTAFWSRVGQVPRRAVAGAAALVVLLALLVLWLGRGDDEPGPVTPRVTTSPSVSRTPSVSPAATPTVTPSVRSSAAAPAPKGGKSGAKKPGAHGTKGKGGGKGKK